ncbi:hypothetical protein FJZ36_01705 [Candidatus Poribacteria bacterium]|nr:hypothetical protein [Candidatus Poribacteria bacterium]
MPNGKRMCPAYGGIIAPMTCRESRGKVQGCDARCPYFAPRIVTSGIRQPPHLPLHKCFASYLPQSGVAVAVVSRKNPDGSLRAMFLSLDLWKVGIRDCFVDSGMTDAQLTNEVNQYQPPLAEKTLPECQQLIKWAETISREVGHSIPWEYEHWASMLDDMRRVPPPSGSLYKCAKCGDDLPPKAAELLKQYALRPEIQFYLVCRKCGGEFDDAW